MLGMSNCYSPRAKGHYIYMWVKCRKPLIQWESTEKRLYTSNNFHHPRPKKIPFTYDKQDSFLERKVHLIINLGGSQVVVKMIISKLIKKSMKMVAYISLNIFW